MILRNLLATPSSNIFLNIVSSFFFLLSFGYDAVFEKNVKDDALTLLLLITFTLFESFENSLLLTLPFDICEMIEEVDVNVDDTEEETDVSGDTDLLTRDLLTEVEREIEVLGDADITELATLLLTPLLTLLLTHTNPELLTALERDVKALLSAGDVV